MSCGPVKIIPNVNEFAEGSVTGQMRQDPCELCTATVEERVPPHVPEGEGWVTAEYYMLPRANRHPLQAGYLQAEAQWPQLAEIQRLIGRSLRAAVDMKKLGARHDHH